MKVILSKSLVIWGAALVCGILLLCSQNCDAVSPCLTELENQSKTTLSVIELRNHFGPQVWEKLVHRYRKVVASISRKFLGYTPDAEDLQQLVMMKIPHILKTMRPDGNIDQYIRSTTRNEALRMIRDRKHLASLDAHDNPETGESWKDQFQAPEPATDYTIDQIELVREQVSHLPDDEQHVVRQVYWEDLTFLNIAGGDENRKGTISRIHKRALTKLQERNGLEANVIPYRSLDRRGRIHHKKKKSNLEPSVNQE